MVLSVVGFGSLGTSAVAIWITERRRWVRDRHSADATLAGEDPRLPTRAPALPRTPATASPDATVSRQIRVVEAPPGVRLAGTSDLERISQAGKNYLGDEHFYNIVELESYIHAQRDSIWCLTGLAGEIDGYAILLALKPITVERIKSGAIVVGRHILANDLEQSIDRSDAVYLAMIHGFRESAGFELGASILRRIMESHDRRRPQLILARQGSTQGGLRMGKLGFRSFGVAPFIKATYSDSPHVESELSRYARHQQLLLRRGDQNQL